VLWLTGLSGSGKTTISNALMEIVKPILPSLVLIDGDAIRELFGGLGFDEESRKVQIRRIQSLALFLSNQKIPCIVSALYSNPELLSWNRNNLPGYYEIYVKTPLPEVEKRDTKGFYLKARQGDLVDVVGIDIPWLEPLAPNLIVDTINNDVDSIVMEIIHSVPMFQRSK
jgi:adenylylsulfate kinase-like enzyme